MTGAPDRPSAEDAYRVLGLSPGAEPEEIRAAYLRLVREHPPDRSPEQFERIRDARDMLKDPWLRAQHRLLDADPVLPLSALLDGVPPPRRFVGPAPWRRALREG